MQTTSISFSAVVLIASVMTRSLFAQDALDVPAELSLPQAIAMAEARAPEVALAEHAARAVAASRAGAAVVLPQNPRLTLEVRPPFKGAGLRDTGYSATLDFLFEVGGAPDARVNEIERATDVASAELGVERRRARAAAWAAYLRVQVAERRIAELAAAQAVSERVFAAATQRAESGAAGDIELALASAALAEVRASIEEAEGELAIRAMALRDALDLPATQPIQLTTPLAEPVAAGDPDALVLRAKSARPELEVLRRRLLLLAASDDRLAREVLPRLGVYVGVDAAPASPIFGTVGMSVELPFAQRNRGPRARVLAERAGAIARQSLAERRIAREVIAARQAYEARRAELAIVSDAAVPAAARNLELSEIGWRAGSFDLFRVTTAARELQRVQGRRLDVLEAALLERVALDLAVGGIDR